MQSNKKHLVLCVLFAIVFAIGLNLHTYLVLPFSNQWGVVGPLTKIKYNPNNDIIRFLFLILLPSIIFILLSLIKFTRRLCITTETGNAGFEAKLRIGKTSKLLLCALLLVSLFIIAGECYSRNNPVGIMDNFHEGESLGSAIDYINGKVPYKDTLFVHGVFHDPLRAVLAFKIFGPSIGAVRTLEWILNIIGLALFCIATYFLFQKNICFTTFMISLLLSFLLFRPFHTGFTVDSRDIPLWCFLILSVLIYECVKGRHKYSHNPKVHILLFLLSFIAISTFAYSIDRGFYLTAASVLSATAIYFTHLRKDYLKYIPSILGGYLLGIIVLGLSIKWAYYDFFKYVFIIMPQYKELLDGLIYPFNKQKYCIPVLLCSVVFFWLTIRFVGFMRTEGRGFWQKVKAFYSTHFIEIQLLVLSIFHFRGALGRSDSSHLLKASAPIFILSGYILIKHLLTPLIVNLRYPAFAAGLTLSAVLALHIPNMDFSKWYKFPLGNPDEHFIAENYIPTIAFLKNNLGPEEDFFTMTSEASWYYYIDKQCPARFQIVWLASPYFYQTEIVNSLNSHNVKFILYKNNYWSNAIDSIDNAIRLPLIIKYVNRHYSFFKKIDDNEIWAKEPEDK